MLTNKFHERDRGKVRKPIVTKRMVKPGVDQCHVIVCLLKRRGSAVQRWSTRRDGFPDSGSFFKKKLALMCDGPTRCILGQGVRGSNEPFISPTSMNWHKLLLRVNLLYAAPKKMQGDL